MSQVAADILIVGAGIVGLSIAREINNRNPGLANVCAMKADTSDRFYNVGTGKRTSLKELAELILDITGCGKPINYAPRSQATLVRNRVGCPKQASAEIGFTAHLDLRAGLKQLIEWRANHKAEVEARRRAVGLPI